MLKPKATSRRRAYAKRKALTLLELLIVLVILAALATIAVQALESVGDQARYDATERTLTGVELAVDGDDSSRQGDGTPLLTGFVADVGRLPIAQGNDPQTQLSELWDPVGTLATTFPFQVRSGPSTPVDYSDVSLPCGWRGPYLRFGVGENDLRDAWGMPLEPRDINQNATLDGESIANVAWLPTSGYTDELQVSFADSLASVSGTLSNAGSPPTSSTVVMLVPDPSNPAELEVVTATSSTNSSFVFDDIPIGTRAIHATIDGETLIKYVYVTQDGISINLEVNP